MADSTAMPPGRSGTLREDRDKQELVNYVLADAIPRPDRGGRLGRPMNVLTNMFQVSYSHGITLYIYDVQVTPVVEQGAQRRSDRPLPPEKVLDAYRRAIASMTDLGARQRNAIAFDGRKFAVSAVKLPFDERTVQVELSEGSSAASARPQRRNMIDVKIKCVQQADTRVLQDFIQANRQAIMASGSAFIDRLALALQATNIAFRSDAIGRYKQHGAGGRRFFDRQTAVPIAHGAEIWRGFFQSVLPLQGGLFLNLDVAFSPFLASGPFLEVAAKILDFGRGGGGGGGGRGGARGGRGGGGRGGRGGSYGSQSYDRPAPITQLTTHEQQTLRKALNNAPIRVTHRPSKLEKFRGFTPTSVQTTNFERDGRTISVAQYFSEHHNIQLMHRNLPCAILGQGRVFVPLELCEVVEGMSIPPQKMKTAQVQDMIRTSAQKPDVRINETKQWRTKRAYERNDCLREWQMTVSRDLSRVPARILPAPTVSYERPMREPVRNGAWRLGGSTFVAAGKTLNSIVLLNFTRRYEHDCRGFTNYLLGTLAKLGLRSGPSKYIHYQEVQDDAKDLDKVMKESGKQAWLGTGRKVFPQIFFCFLEENNSVYDSIKRVATTELPQGTPTQCFNVRKAFNDRGQDQYCENVAMKINIKMGGVNHVLCGRDDLPKLGDQTMLIGMDVRHSSPGSQQPSIVACVATTNGRGTRFTSETMLQTNNNNGQAQEVVLNGQDMFVNLLRAWQASNAGKLPLNVVFVRDGVSQGEYMAVSRREIDDFLRACSSKEFGGSGYRPKLTFVVCTKRHRVRFFPSSPGDGDRSGNLPPGLVVDTSVVHPYAFDFYMQAHAGLVGTTRPAHCVVLRNEQNFTSDELQRLCYSLCHTYARSTRSVSQISIVKYAHFLAEKAAITLLGTSMADSMSMASGQSKEVDHDDAIKRHQASREKCTEVHSADPHRVKLSDTLWFM